MHDHTAITVDLDTFNHVRSQATRRHQLRFRAVILGILALVLAAVTHRLVALPLLAVSALCAAIVVGHEVGERRRRRAVAGSLGRRWH